MNSGFSRRVKDAPFDKEQLEKHYNNMCNLINIRYSKPSYENYILSKERDEIFDKINKTK